MKISTELQKYSSQIKTQQTPDQYISREKVEINYFMATSQQGLPSIHCQIPQRDEFAN